MDVRIELLQGDAWKLWSDMRMRAVTTNPESFGSTLADDSEISEEEWRRRLDNSPHYVAYDGDNPVGIMCAVPEQGEKNRHIVWIYSVFVEPDARGKGVAKQLLGRLIADQEQSPTAVKLMLQAANNESAVRLYEGAGFQRLALLKKQMYVNGSFVDEWLMERFLK
jgi:ribosomal protein S18 acetylase RimI-like enzyme